MNRHHRAREGMALPVVLLMIVLAGGLIAAAAYQRQNASRHVAAALQRQEAFAIAEAAVREVCRRSRLQQLFTQEQARLTRAFAQGDWHAPLVVEPASLDLEVSPAATRMRLAQDPTTSVSEVRLELTEYRQGLANQGTLRGAVWVRRKLGERQLDYRLALDYAIQFRKAGGGLLVLVSREPKARVTS